MDEVRQQVVIPTEQAARLLGSPAALREAVRMNPRNGELAQLQGGVLRTRKVKVSRNQTERVYLIEGSEIGPIMEALRADSEIIGLVLG